MAIRVKSRDSYAVKMILDQHFLLWIFISELSVNEIFGELSDLYTNSSVYYLYITSSVYYMYMNTSVYYMYMNTSVYYLYINSLVYYLYINSSESYLYINSSVYFLYINSQCIICITTVQCIICILTILITQVLYSSGGAARFTILVCRSSGRVSGGTGERHNKQL